MKYLMPKMLCRYTVLTLVSWLDYYVIIIKFYIALLMINLSHPAFSLSVQITGSEATLAPGQNYSLTCGANGPVSAYQWRRDGVEISTDSESTLSLSPLTLSDAGQYTCQVTVDGMMANSPPQDIRLTS